MNSDLPIKVLYLTDLNPGTPSHIAQVLDGKTIIARVGTEVWYVDKPPTPPVV